MNYQIPEAYAQAKYLGNFKPYLNLPHDEKMIVGNWFGEIWRDNNKMMAEWLERGGKWGFISYSWAAYSIRIDCVSEFLPTKLKKHNNSDFVYIRDVLTLVGMNPHVKLYEQPLWKFFAAGTDSRVLELIEKVKERGFEVIHETI